MKTLITLVFVGSVCLLAGLAAANPVPVAECDWENDETVFHVEGTGDPAIIVTNVDASDPVHGGGHALRLVDNSPSGTPEAYIAYAYGLHEGDQITCGFWRYDDTPDAAPSVRIWAHWNNSLPDDITAEDGSAGGNSDYGTGTGWEWVEHTWTIPEGVTGIVIEARVYSSSGDTVWIDDLMLATGADSHLVTPCMSVVENDQLSFGALKAVYR